MSWLLDTDVLSESSKLQPNERVRIWLDAHDHDLHLSTISLGEIIKGIELMKSGKRRKAIEAWFTRLERWAGSRLLAPTEAVMTEWGRLCARHERMGRRLPVLDSLIAATAITHHLTLVTRNTDDYPKDIPLLNPWKVSAIGG